MRVDPKVSIVIPTFGRTDYLSQAIDSVYQQTYTNLELIIVDDNNPDSEFRLATEKVVARKRAEGRELIYLQHDKNRNGSTARNTGIKHASGEFIGFLDADDMYLPSRIERLRAIMHDAPADVGGVYTGVEFRREDKTYGYFADASPGKFLVETLACRFRLGTGSNLFLRRSAIDSLGGFDEAFWRHQDYEFMVRFFEKYFLAATSEVLVIKNNENFNLPKFSNLLTIKEQYLNKYRFIIERLPKSEMDYILYNNYKSLGELALKEGLRHESRAMYSMACQHGALGGRDKLRRVAMWLASCLK